MAQGTITPPDDNIDDNLIHDKNLSNSEWSDFVDNHSTSDGSIRATGREDAADLPTSNRSRGPAVDESGHITAADNVGQNRQQGGGSSMDMAKKVAKQAAGAGGGGSSAATKALGAASSGKDGDKPETAKDKAADKAADAAQIAEAAATIESPTAWLTLAKQAKKHWRALALVSIIALLPVFILIFIVFYAAANPFEFMKAAITNKALGRFVVQSADAIGLPGAAQVRTVLERAGLVIKIEHSNTAIAAPSPTTKPDPGSIDDILARIDWKKAQWQYGNDITCKYRFTFAPFVNYDGQTINEIDKAYDKTTGKEVPPDQATEAVNTCFMNSYPMFNMSTRNPAARSVNKFSDAFLAYSTDKSELYNKPQSEVNKALLEKTVKRIEEKQDSAPKSTEQKVTDFSNRVYSEIQQGKDPEALDYDAIAASVGLTFPNNDQDPQQVTDSMCTYYQVFTAENNVVKGIYSRRDAAVRNALKFLSLAGSGAMYQNSNKEINYTAASIANWADGAGYSLSVGNGNQGIQANAESIHNRAYIIKPEEAIRIGLALRPACAYANFGFPVPIIQQVIKNVGQTAVFNLYKTFRATVVAESSGIFEIGNPNNFGLKDILIGSFRLAGAASVTGTEAGPQNLNRQAMGVQQLTSDYLRTVGGRFLTEQEQAELAVRVEDNARQNEQNKSFLARIFDTASPRSIASQLASRNTSWRDTATYMASTTASLVNIPKLFTDTSSLVAYVATGQKNTAFAASDDIANYFKVDLAGFSSNELKSTNLLDNARAIEKLKKDISDPNDIRTKQMQYYDACFKKDIPNPILFTRIPEDPKDISNTDPAIQKKYLYIKDGFKIGGDGNQLTYNQDVDSDFFKAYTCETTMTNSNPLNMPNINLDFARKYRLYVYYKSQVELLQNLSSDTAPKGFYAGSSKGGAGSGQRNPGGFIWPIGGKTVFSRCGNGHGYQAVDIAYVGNLKPDIYAVADGEVVLADNSNSSSGYGNYLIIKQNDGLYTLYAHNSEVTVAKGDRVSQGDVVAIGGSSGDSSGPHLHFEVRTEDINGPKQNPGDYLPDTPDGQNTQTYCESN
ncbi:M23 family metallopeptidase [Candidatus Saccharibacteria bacterium]|nr:M23 family metallopeptidase [Candidatus Saccharibacteria bacterium]